MNRLELGRKQYAKFIETKGNSLSRILCCRINVSHQVDFLCTTLNFDNVLVIFLVYNSLIKVRWSYEKISASKTKLVDSSTRRFVVSILNMCLPFFYFLLQFFLGNSFFVVSFIGLIISCFLNFTQSFYTSIFCVLISFLPSRNLVAWWKLS